MTYGLAGTIYPKTDEIIADEIEADAAHKRQYKDSRSGGDLAFCHTK